MPYEGPNGIRALLEGMQALLGWEPINDGDNIIGLVDPTAAAAISLEPGGQFELSGAPLKSIHQHLPRGALRTSPRCGRSPTRSASASSGSA